MFHSSDGKSIRLLIDVSQVRVLLEQQTKEEQKMSESPFEKFKKMVEAAQEAQEASGASQSAATKVDLADAMDQVETTVSVLSGLRKQLIEQGWSDNGAELAVIKIIERGI